MVEIDSRKASLIAEIEVSRGEMRGALRRCEASLNPVTVLRRNIRSNAAAWLSTAALAGLALSQIVRLRLRRGPAPSKYLAEPWAETGRQRSHGSGNKGGGWILWVGRVAFDLLRPALLEWATEQLSNLARAKGFARHPQTRNGVRPSIGKKGAAG